MEVKYTKHFLHKLEDLFSETDYQLRYEKGSFNSGISGANPGMHGNESGGWVSFRQEARA